MSTQAEQGQDAADFPEHRQASRSEACSNDTRVEEVRIAAALNGGASLAVWMGGCVVELDAARRGVETYGELCDALDRRLVVDILAGTSAGGINAALLAAAVRWRRCLTADLVRTHWTKNGELGDLLRAETDTNASSLLSGERFFEGLLAAFHALGAQVDPFPRQQSASEANLQLRIPVTHLKGEERRFRDTWGELIAAREFRGCFRFDDESDFTPQGLALAARASASFPGAFPPVWVGEEKAYTSAGFASAFWAVDGGVLDNAPIEHAARLIPSRPASAQVARFLMYVVADPERPTTGATASDATEPRIDHVISSVLSSPREETVIENLRSGRDRTLRARLSAQTTRELLSASDEVLSATAYALFDAYAEARAALTIDDVIDCLADRGIFLDDKPGAEIQAPERLPWVPDKKALNTHTLEGWQWGTRPLERLVHVLLDDLREHLRPSATTGLHESTIKDLTGVRDLCDLALSRTRAARDVHITQVGIILQAATPNPSRDDVIRAADTASTAPSVSAAMKAAEKATTAALADFYKERSNLTLGPFYKAAPLAYGPDNHAASPEPDGHAPEDPDSDQARIDGFVWRMLQVEVIRGALRATDEVESAQRVQFALLTPNAPCAFRGDRARWGARDKLAGVMFQHFGAFYRPAWRVNDFMWGRLDTIARLVFILLDDTIATRAKVDQAWRDETAQRLAEALRVKAREIDGAGGKSREAERRLFALFNLDIDSSAKLPAAVADSLACDLARLRHAFVLVLQTAAAKQELAAMRETLADKHADRGTLHSPRIQTESFDEIATTIESLPRGLGLIRPPAGRSDELASPRAVALAAQAAGVATRIVDANAGPITSALGLIRVGLLALSGLAAYSRIARIAASAAALTASAFLATAARAPAADDPSAGAATNSPSTVGLATSLGLTAGALLVLTGASAFMYLRGNARTSTRAAWRLGAIAVVGAPIALLYLIAWHQDGMFLSVLVRPIVHSPLSDVTVKIVIVALAVAASGRLSQTTFPWLANVPILGRITVTSTTIWAVLVYLTACAFVVVDSTRYLLGGKHDWILAASVATAAGTGLVVLLAAFERQRITPRRGQDE